MLAKLSGSRIQGRAQWLMMLIALLCFHLPAWAETEQDQATPQSRTAFVVTGQVVDPDGVGVRGASISMDPLPPVYQRLLRQGINQERDPRHHTLSDKAGFFSLTTAEPGVYRVTVRAEGYRRHDFRIQPLTASRDLPKLTLVPEAPVKVTVRGESGPLAGARLFMTSSPPRSRSMRAQPGGVWRLYSESMRSDDNGSAVLGSGRGESQTLWVSAPGHLPQELSVAQSRRAVVTLKAGKSRWIQVRETSGKPVAGTLVLMAKSWLVIAQTDEQGRAELAVPKGGASAISLVLPDGRRSRHTISDAPAEAPPTIITVEPPAWIDGQVVEEKTREPIAGAFVVPADDSGASVETDNQGGFRLLRVAGRSHAGAAAVGYVPAGQSTDVESAPEPVLALTPAARIRDAPWTSVGNRCRSPRSQPRYWAPASGPCIRSASPSVVRTARLPSPH